MVVVPRVRVSPFCGLELRVTVPDAKEPDPVELLETTKLDPFHTHEPWVERAVLMIEATAFRFVAEEKLSPVKFRAVPSMVKSIPPLVMPVKFERACCAVVKIPPRLKPDEAVLSQRPIIRVLGFGN